MQACKHGHLACVKELLGVKDIQVDAIDANGKTALILAVINGHKDIVSLLEVFIQHNGDVSVTHLSSTS
jgi:ankyrin repeat protein